MRHAKAELLAPGQRDYDRPLAARGHQDAARIGKALRAMKISPDAILASPARRARETAEEVVKALKHSEEIRWDKSLYDARGDAWLSALRKLGPSVEVVVVVAHNPGAEDAAALVVGATTGFLDCPTAGVVAIDADPPSWKELRPGAGTLRWFLRPKLLEALE